MVKMGGTKNASQALLDDVRGIIMDETLPPEERIPVLGEAEFFGASPEGMGLLLGIVLEGKVHADVCGAAAKALEGLIAGGVELSEGDMGKVKAALESALGGKIKLREDHIARIAGTMAAGPGRRAVQEAQRDNALWMLAQIVAQGMPIPRERCQGKIMNAAVEILPEEGSPDHGQQKERKIYGLRGARLILGDWLEKLKKEADVPNEWYFRPEDLERLRADTKHPDPEVRMEAMMVNEVLV